MITMDGNSVIIGIITAVLSIVGAHQTYIMFIVKDLRERVMRIENCLIYGDCKKEKD